jgi:putative tryptophan/tyrosine transport system substrate-binding protein
MDRRRFLLASLAGALAAPLAAEAQSTGKSYRVGYLSSGASVLDPFRQALRELGYIEGQNLKIEARLAAGRLDRLPALAAELVRARVDVIAAVSPPAIQAAKDATTTIPIVMAFVSIDPVQSGFVDSLAHPGGNITGVAMIADTISGKRLALLKEMLPQAARLAVLAQVHHSSSTSQAKAAREVAGNLGIELDLAEVRDSRDYDTALAAVTKRTPGLFVLANPTFFEDRQQLAPLATKHRLATLCEWREMAEAGCLMSYGPNVFDLYRRVGTYVDRIARGATPADLPVEQPTKFELVINLKTAKALGLTIPPSVLARADQVIE